MLDKYNELFAQYNCDQWSDSQVAEDVKNLLAAHFEENNNVEVWKQCLNQIDLTTLCVDDTTKRVLKMVDAVNDFEDEYPDCRNVASICVYPAFAETIKSTLTAPGVGITCVAAGFPASQTFIEVKVAEVAMAVQAGATEIDIVQSVGKFLEEQYDEVYEEICELRAAAGDAHFKVILETGALLNVSNIRKASILAMQAGADFIKTSTGKVSVNATPEATYVMCHAIKDWYEKTGIKVGYKPAGGVRTTAEAVQHYTIVKEVLGEEWLNNKFFRFGASSLANNLLTSIEGKEVKYF